ncbi:MAG: hypothetical protein ACRDIY_07445 [Chloroflexota bacterium]
MATDQSWARLYHNVSLVECDSKDVLDELLSLHGLDLVVVARISDRVAVVDGQQRAQTARALARLGHSYRVTDLLPRAPGSA